MRLLTVILLFFISGNQGEPDIEQVRELYAQAPRSEDSAEKLINLLEPHEEDALWLGYRGVATMIMAKHVFSPFKKMSLFKDGREMLKQAIDMNEDNVELRFLRYSAQTQAPAFLGYKDNVEEDQVFLIETLSEIEDDSLKRKVRSFLLESEELTEEEKELIQIRIIK